MPKTGKRKIRAVLFDWDGTLLNSYQADAGAYQAMFAEMGIPWTVEDLATHYAKHKPSMITGAHALLATLCKKYELGLVTSGDRERVTGQLREFRLLRTFSARVCGGDTENKKP